MPFDPRPISSTNLTLSSESLETVVSRSPALVVKQRKEISEIVFGLETRNRYLLLDHDAKVSGTILEQGGGFVGLIKRILLKTHRPFTIDIRDTSDHLFLTLKRKFFFFFSDIEVISPKGQKIGSAHRRFAILHKLYDLRDQTGQTFARTRSPIWRIWTFQIIDSQSREKAVISKKWGGVLKEIFTEADSFLISFKDASLTPAQRAVVLALAISVDFDFFSNTSRNG